MKSKSVSIEWGETRSREDRDENGHKVFRSNTIKLGVTVDLAKDDNEVLVIGEKEGVLRNLVKSFLTSNAHDENGVKPQGGA